MDKNSIYKSVWTKNASAMSIFFFKISNIVYFPCSTLLVLVFLYCYVVQKASSFSFLSYHLCFKKINKHCIVTSGHFIVSKSCFVLKVMANIWNSISQNIFLHGALNLKTCKSLCFLDRL